MEIGATAIAGLMLLRPEVHGDERGWFSEVFRRDVLAAAGLAADFVLDGQSYSRLPGTLRGLHWQAPPHGQTKLVRVLRGAVLDIAVDLRRGSASHGRHVAVELSAANRLQLLIPRGFAHGFLTLEPDTEMLYRLDAPHRAAASRGVHYADPELALPWPASPPVAAISEKDRTWPGLRALPEPYAD